jgi:hypothetical protein
MAMRKRFACLAAVVFASAPAFAGLEACGGSGSASSSDGGQKTGLDSAGVDVTTQAQGGLGQPCYANSTCNAGLTCVSPVCVQVDASGTPDTGAPDGPGETGVVDSGAADTATADSGGQPSDSGVPETSAPDSGAPDTGAVDSGVADTGAPPDTGSPDTGSPDTGSPDTGSPDTGSPDTGSPADSGVDAEDFDVAPG